MKDKKNRSQKSGVSSQKKKKSEPLIAVMTLIYMINEADL